MTGFKRNFGISLLTLAFGLVVLVEAAYASKFTDALRKDYYNLARVQYYYSHDRFAVKARTIDAGKIVLPDDPAKFKVPRKSRSELKARRPDLMSALNKGFREQNPKQASRAQTMFDCWLRAAVERDQFSAKNIATCRKGFLAAMKAWTPPVVAAPAAPAPPPKPVAKPKPKPAPPPAPRAFLVFFDWNKAIIRPDAQKVLETAAAYAKRRGLVRVNLAGHADRSGDASYNMRLSLRRAQAAKAALVKLGIKAENISVVGRGESQPLVATADGVREPRNRRVEIAF